MITEKTLPSTEQIERLERIADAAREYMTKRESMMRAILNPETPFAKGMELRPGVEMAERELREALGL